MSTPDPIDSKGGPAAVVVKVLRWIGILAVNPALGGGGLSRERLATLAARLASLVEGGADTWEELKAFALEIRAMAETGAEPSAAQWQAMRGRDAVVRATLASRAEELETRERVREEREAAEAKAREEERLRLEAEEAERLRLEAEAAAGGPQQ